MYACASCLEARDVRLFDVRVDGQAIRTWWCPECAFVERRRGLEVEPAPAWIERAALRQLPVKELPDPERPSLQMSFGLFGRSTDRRRGDRRRQRVATR
jgi:hypothetical protein